MSTPPPSPSYIPGPIWPPDWSQFIPDALGAIITGAIIGFVLWRVETKAGSRREEREAEALWKARRGAVGLAMNASLETWHPNNPSRNFPLQWAGFLSVVDPRVVLWADAAPKNREIALASALAIDLPLLDRLLTDLESIATVDIPVVARLEGPMSSEAVDYVLNRFIGESSQDEFTTMREARLDPIYEEIYLAVMDPEEIGSTIPLFKTTLRRAEQNWTELWDRVGD